MRIPPKELATILAALRYYQRYLKKWKDAPRPVWDIATNEGKDSPLTVTEIDALCEKLNR